MRLAVCGNAKLGSCFSGTKGEHNCPKNPSRVKLETLFIEDKPVPNSYRWFFTILFQISATVCTGLCSQSHSGDAYRLSQVLPRSSDTPGGKRDPNMHKRCLCPAQGALRTQDPAVRPQLCLQVLESMCSHLVWPCHLVSPGERPPFPVAKTIGPAMPVPQSQASERLGLDISRCLFGFSYFLVFNWFQM